MPISHMWLVASVLDTSDVEQYEVLNAAVNYCLIGFTFVSSVKNLFRYAKQIKPEH